MLLWFASIGFTNTLMGHKIFRGVGKNVSNFGDFPNSGIFIPEAVVHMCSTERFSQKFRKIPRKTIVVK